MKQRASEHALLAGIIAFLNFGIGWVVFQMDDLAISSIGRNMANLIAAVLIVSFSYPLHRFGALLLGESIPPYKELSHYLLMTV